MEIVSWVVAFVFTFVWVMFVSYVVGSFLYRDASPIRRAALTAGTATVLAALISLGLELFMPRLPGVPAVDLVSYLLFIPAGLAEFGMLYRWFKARWVSDEEVAEAFH